jgi:tetraacyldisaccharide 4'-kinase
MAHDNGPVPAALGVLGEPVYRIVVRARNRSFDRGRRVTRLPVPVISVGNISVGGTGKTPFVMMIVEMLRSAGVRPAIAMRGYKAEREGGSDEEAEYRDRWEDVPVAAQPDRVGGIRALLGERKDIGCVVLDDGFQHRFVARDLDIVLIDATRDPFADHCLPRGWLREPVESLGRADVVVMTRADAIGSDACDRMEERVRGVSDALVVRAAHDWDRIAVGDRVEPVSWLGGRRVVATCAIGNPGAFINQLRAGGADVAAILTERDHHRWTHRDIERLVRLAAAEKAEAIATTDKDWVKLRRLDLAPLGVPVVRPRVRMGILGAGEALRDRVIGAARAGIAGESGARRA